ncbi:MAG: NrtA/SsuA/CpmA family ABC transporter substrate-binding protein [Treponema sp.]|nr:NrtA/SsuA/CpmA family ABC transporter substrate-binding protein [Treponema sp.]
MKTNRIYAAGKLWAKFGMMIVAAAAFTSCGGKAPEGQGRTVLRVAYLPTANYVTSLTQGKTLEEELAKTGAAVEWIGPSEPFTAYNIVTSGNADISSTGTGYLINLIEQDGPWVAFALEKYSGNSQGIAAAPGSGVNSLADLYGKKIGIDGKGATGEYIVNTAFAYAGLDVSKVEKVELIQNDFAAAFTSGRIDALASFDQNFANALAVPGAKKLIDGTEYGSLNWSIHIASTDFAEKHPEVLAAAYRALRAEAARAKAAPEIITNTYRDFGASEEQIAVLKTFDIPQILPLDSQAVADLNRQARQYADYGFIKSAPRNIASHTLDFSGENQGSTD